MSLKVVFGFKSFGSAGRVSLNSPGCSQMQPLYLTEDDVLELAQETNEEAWKYITRLLRGQVDLGNDFWVVNLTGSKVTTYRYNHGDISCGKSKKKRDLQDGDIQSYGDASDNDLFNFKLSGKTSKTFHTGPAGVYVIQNHDTFYPAAGYVFRAE